MRILWLTWKDREHPDAGGAETVNETLARELVKNSHSVDFVVAGYQGGASQAARDGFRIVRVGNRWTVYWHAWRLYRTHGRGKYDLVIDETNTVPFFAGWYVREPVIAFFHQLAREIWFYEMPWPVAIIGYLLEPLYLRLMRARAFVTISESTRRDLEKHGIASELIKVIPQALDLEIPAELPPEPPEPPVMLSFGATRAMKRGIHVLRAFEIAKRELPSLRLIVAGDLNGRYGRKFGAAIAGSPYSGDIDVLGRVAARDRGAVFRRAHVLCAASVKEGWGLVVSEAAAQGVPSVVYDVDGLRDSVQDGVTGMVLKRNDPESMAKAVIGIMKSPAQLEGLRHKAWSTVRGLNVLVSSKAFSKAFTEV